MKDEIGEVWSTYGGESVYRVLVGKPERRRPV
jgi:hypothetical protein